MSSQRKLKIGLALGGGSARGWAHVGVIRALAEAGVEPDLVCGTSAGALVGAAFAAGELNRFEEWLLGLGRRDVAGFLDLSMNGGVLKGERLMTFLRRTFVDRPVEDLAIPFAAVATELGTGAEVWLREGSTVEAVRASIALPGVFSPVARDGMFLVDGGLVNPVPVSLARAMGAQVVIAVDLNSDILGRHLRDDSTSDGAPAGQVGEWLRRLQDNLGVLGRTEAPEEPRMPSMLGVVASSINIMQVRITRSRMAGDPPDVTLTPRLAHLGLFDFHRAAEAIAEGRRTATAAMPDILELVGRPS